MILRKPYAIFIKYFKFMHLVMSAMTIYLMYKTGFLYTFFNEKISSVTIGNNSYDLTDKLFNFYIFIIPFVIIIISLLILSVLMFKKKPYKFYFFNIFVFIVAIVMNGYFYDIVLKLETGFVEVRQLRLVRDLIMFILIFETLTLFKNIVSATGFDVKKFDFRKDLEDLNIDDNDREEFEFEVKLDTDKAKRTLRGSLRHLRYVYLENRFLVNFVGLLTISVLSFTIYFNLNIYNKVFVEKSAFSAGNMSMMITNSYIVKTDYKGNKISDDKSLVILEMNIRNNFNVKNKLEMARSLLDISGQKYIHTHIYRDRLFDLGISYDDRNLSTSFEKYLLVYEVPNSQIDNSMLFMYYDKVNYISGELGPSIIKIKVEPKNLEKNKKITDISLSESVTLKEPFLESVFKVTEFAIEKSFALEYSYCPVANECYSSKEYLVPGYNGNENLVLLKLGGNISWNDKLKHVKYSNLFSFIRDFGVIEYEHNGGFKRIRVQNAVVPNKTKSEFEFLEVPSELLASTSIKIVFTVRNNQYNYVLK